MERINLVLDLKCQLHITCHCYWYPVSFSLIFHIRDLEMRQMMMMMMTQLRRPPLLLLQNLQRRVKILKMKRLKMMRLRLRYQSINLPTPSIISPLYVTSHLASSLALSLTSHLSPITSHLYFPIASISHLSNYSVSARR